MAKVIRLVKNNIFGFVFGVIITLIISVYAASTLSSSSVYYDNSTSGGSSTTVSGALDELYDLSDIRNRPNIIVGYTYNQTSGASNYCITGDEDTCVETKCYESTTAGSCPAGTIIVYKVNENETVRFHVMYDNGSTMTMQSQRNTIYTTMWINAADYSSENTDSTVCSNDSCNDEGPITILEALESATVGWVNVNSQTYTMGSTVFKTNAYTGCSPYNSCTTNKYTLPSRTAKARMITIQEAAILGCSDNSGSCPIWMYNYLAYTLNNDNSMGPNGGMGNYGYWTMNADSSTSDIAWSISLNGNFSNYYMSTDSIHMGTRAVVEINK